MVNSFLSHTHTLLDRQVLTNDNQRQCALTFGATNDVTSIQALAGYWVKICGIRDNLQHFFLLRWLFLI